MDDSQGRRIPARTALATLWLLVLAACGGGGGGNNLRASPPPAAPPPAPPVVETPNPEFSKHLMLTNASAAHAAGFSGHGVSIGVVDTGVNRNHPALWPRVTSNLVYIGSPPNDLSVDDVDGHGTAVAQIMAGTPFGQWPGGIAPGAEIVSARIISDEPPPDDGSGQGNEVDGALGLKPIHQDLIDRGARIMNNSWGGLYWTDPNATAPIADEYRPFIIGNDGLVVFATGNEAAAHPTDMAALPSQPGPNGTLPAADLERGWLAVAALDTDNPTQLAPYSNACGIAMRYCLVAPGTVVVTGTDDASNDPSYWEWSGTSLAAPQVSGAAALVWEAFPYFDNDLVRQTLLGTATDLGAAGPDAVFGYGLLNVGEAVQGPARFDWGTVTADFDGFTSTWGNPIDGAGGLVKSGTGTLVLGEDNTYAGGTLVQGGTLQVRGLGLGSGDVAVESGAMLSMTPQSGPLQVGGDLANRGTVQLAPDAGLDVAGHYSQDAGSRLALYVGNVVTADTATLQGGDLQVLGVKPGYTYQSREDVLVTSNGLTGTFASLSAGAGVFLDATLGYDANRAWLDIARLDVSVTAQSLGFSPMSVASATRVESAFRVLDGTEDSVPPEATPAFVDAAGAFQRTPTAAAAEYSLASLSGELHGADTAFALMAIDGNRHALETRLDAVSRAGTAGAWVQELHAQRALADFDMDTAGWLLGQDARAGDWLYGAAFGETAGYAWHGLRRDRERNRQVEGQLYAQWMRGRDQVLGRLALGRMERWLQRDVLLGTDVFAVDTDYADRYTTLGLEAGHRFEFATGWLTPYAGAQALRLERDGFAEQGAAGFGLSTRDSSFTATQALLGARFDRQWQARAVRIAVNARIEWQRTLSQSGADIDARFTALDVWTPIIADGLAPEAGVFVLGASVGFPRWGEFGLDLDGRHERGRSDARASLRWSVPFE